MIAIPEMKEMPKSCHKCPISYWVSNEMKGGLDYSGEPNENWCPWNNCITDEIHGGHTQRMKNCPLKEITESE